MVERENQDIFSVSKEDVFFRKNGLWKGETVYPRDKILRLLKEFKIHS